MDSSRPPLNSLDDQQRPVLKGKKRQYEHTRLESINEVYMKACCENDCCSNYSVDEILKEREFYWSLSVEKQRSFIFAQLRNSVSYQFAVCGKNMCEVGWRQLYGIKRRRYYELKRRLVIKEEPLPSITKLKTPSRVKLQARTWLQNYIQLHAERMPDREELHLPHCVSKDAIFQQYRSAMIEASEKHLSVSSFNDMWLKGFPNVKISKGKNGQPKCTPCTNIAAALNMSLTKEEREMVETKRKLHFNLQGICRAKYYKHIKKARENPQTYVSVIIDNMDQAKTRLPNFAVYSKVDAQLNKMQHHVTGVKVHSIEKTFILTWTDMFHPDCNVTLNTLVYVLHAVSLENDGRMPPTLYLQADNSGKDNKNSFVMVFLAWLIKVKIFKKVKLGFLMVGHTHEDIDQVFSRISTHQSHVDAPTLPDLHKAIRDSTTPAPVVSSLTGIYDYKEKLEHCRGLIEGISAPHQFVFKEVDGKIVMIYKNWPIQTEECRSLDLTEHIPDMQNLHSAALNTKMDVESQKMQTDLTKWNKGGRLSSDHLSWWREYLSRQSSVHINVPAATALPTFREVENCAEDSSHLQQAILRNAEKETLRTTLKVKKKKRR
ncbi:uncharacterized protein LOC132749532 [Ruditapes philippinarum]|uniref:uncharacterized protein LOC132749532 n=1 Tax=Ruditapes philippinarum TaxID=129788 RepID=UPI00295B3E52|nr:uncharacterized protein LOC132749532 [Ruditapes philippinarum]XP_060595321.1 uncharacterized protein LOC132749532 [Ruditapes philippinarum]XP_060595322.1 uncharacterized protein LOC132749532 [Ruditapes philippinarum]